MRSAFAAVCLAARRVRRATQVRRLSSGGPPPDEAGLHCGDAIWAGDAVAAFVSAGSEPVPCRQRLPGEGQLSAWSTVVEGFVESGRFGAWVFAP